MYGNTQHTIGEEDQDFIRDWENFVVLKRLPHELGYTAEPCHEDFEAIKEMKRWMNEKQKRDSQKSERMKGIKQRAAHALGEAGLQ